MKRIFSAITAVITLGTCTVLNPTETKAVGIISSETANFYENWKERYIVLNPYETEPAQYFVMYGDGLYSETGYETPVTVSEAHGYGMLITACMAEYDSEAKEIFDGMYDYYKAHLSGIGPNLMAWQQSDNGSGIVDSSGVDSAIDGDMDIAYALLLADTVWGSDGEINYKQAAVDMINDIMKYEVNQTDWTLRLGDWTYWSDESDKYYTATRPSDFMMQHLTAFADATGDERWIKVYNSTYTLINGIVEQYGTGILPDFMIKDSATGEFIPAPANFLESENDGNYYYNSCRTPWRISLDYLVSGNEDALEFAKAITEFMINDTNGDPWEIRAGYTTDGKRVEDYNDLCFVAPLLVAAKASAQTEWHDALRDTILNYGDDVYYGDTIKMLCLIADDGAWLTPSAESNDTVIGDVNADGVFSVADVVAMQKWLLKVEDASLADWNAGDLSVDGQLDIFDLIMMKKLLSDEINAVS